MLFLKSYSTFRTHFQLMHKKISGSTLIEVLIAMVIIMAVFSIAIALFGNVLRSGVSVQKVAVRSQMKYIGDQIAQRGYLETEELEIDSVFYHLQTDNTAVPGLAKLNIRAELYGKPIDSLSLLFQTKTAHAEN